MSMPEEPGGQPSELQQRQPTRQLLLAQALELCIQAERREPGSAQTVIAQQPAWARGDLTRLVALAGSLDAVGSNAVMSDAFRGAARSRLMARIGGDASASVWPAAASRLTSLPPRAIPPRTGHRRKALLWRTSAGLLAAVLSVTATLTASASALPGEPLYGLKQAQEELGVRLAADDKARALALLRTADARLDETSRLLAQGRTGEAVQATQRYDQVVERATTTFVVTVEGAASDPPVAVHMDTRLSQQQEQLQALLQTAPEPARADLREALVATERGRALVADPRAVERALGRASGRRNATSGVAPTPAAEEMATLVPTRGPLVVAQAAATAQPTVVVAEADEHRGGSPAVAQTGDVRRADASDGERDAGTPVRPANGNGTGTGTGTGNGTAGRGTASGTARPTNAGPGLAGGQGDASPQRGRDGGDDNESDRAAQHGDDIHVAPAQPVVARDEPVAVRPGFGGASVTTSNGRTTGGDDATGGQANRGTGTGTGTAQRDDTAQVQRGSGEDTARAPQQGTVRQVATPVVVAQADNRAPGTGAAGSGGAAGTTAGAAGTSGRGGEQPARAAGPAQATTNGGATNDRTTNRDDSEARSPTASATQSTATRPQPTATPTPQRRNTDSASSAQPTRTPTPTETTRSGDTSKPAATPTRTRTPEPPRGGPD